MSTWRLANGPRLRCGNCRMAIAAGQAYLTYQIGATHLRRCQACGESMTGAPAPDSIEESAPSLDVRHQPSLHEQMGLEPVSAVAGRSAIRRRFAR